MARTKRIPLAGVVSLGCSKNLVDTEYLVGGLGAGGWGFVPDRERADLLLVNTCAFIGPAVEESHEAIAEAVRWKAGRAGRIVVVAGCMVNRFAKSLRRATPRSTCCSRPSRSRASPNGWRSPRRGRGGSGAPAGRSSRAGASTGR